MNRLAVFVIHFVDRFLFLLGSFRRDDTGPGCLLAHRSRNFRIVGNPLSDNVHRSLQRFFCRGHCRLRIFRCLCRICKCSGARLCGFTASLPKDFSQRRQASCFCLGCACCFFLLKRLVKIFHTLEHLRLFDLRLQFFSKRSLLLYQANDFSLSLFQIAQVRQPFIETAERHIIHTAGNFLSVPGDKRNRVSFVDEFYGLFYLMCSKFEFFC